MRRADHRRKPNATSRKPQIVERKTEILTDEARGIDRAAALLRAGQLVAFPSETVYGLGGDARDGRAVAEIFAAKGRPSFNPLIVHVPDVQAAQRYVAWPQTADALAQAFWPGPLTLVLPLRAGHGLSDLVTAGLPTLAVRAPAHPLAQKLLRRFDGPLAGPSANPSGRISPTTTAHVTGGLSGRIAAVLDGGACPVGIESTIVGLDQAAPVLLRAGGIPREAIEAALGQSLAAPGSAITAPGQMTSHYAPSAPVRLNAAAPLDGEFMIGFADVPGDLTLSATGDLHEAAANLFGMLHLANETGQPIAVAAIPPQGLGAAINDRLRRAAAPRQA